MIPIHAHICKGSTKLLVFLNGMDRVGTTNNHFSCYNILQTTFEGYDILFLKDIKKFYWYLTIMQYISNLIQDLIQTHSYTYLYGITYSSGTICLLNILPRFAIFKQAVLINGQTNLTETMLATYKHKCFDCSVFSKQIVSEDIDDSVLRPLETCVPKEMLEKFVFYYANSVSDTAYYTYNCSIYPPNLAKTNLFYLPEKIAHHKYAEILFSNPEYMKGIRTRFDECV